MPGPLLAGIAGSIGSAAIQAKSAKNASNAQTQAAAEQVAESRRQFDVIQGLLKPYVTAGTGALQSQLDLMGIGGRTGVAGQPDISAQDAQRNAIQGISGGAQFNALAAQGEEAILANASATGGLRGGDTQGVLAQFRPQMLQSLIQQQLANFGGVAANGQQAAGMTGQAAQNTGQQVNQSLGDRGAAQAGSFLAQGQAWQNAGAGILQTMGGLAKPMQPGGGAFQKWSF